MVPVGQIQEYSDGYYILDVDVLEHGGESAILPRDLAKFLSNYVKRPVFHIGNRYFVGHVEHAVPANTIALPKGRVDVENATVLVAKDDTALDLIYDDEIEDWRG